MNDDELEQVMRAGLEGRAGEADVTETVLARVRPVARRRRRGTVVLTGLAAAAVIAATVGGAALIRGDEPSALDVSASDEAPSSIERWRTEVWGDIQVEVPADWGYGGAPDARGLACFPEAVLDASGRQVRDSAEVSGYVGRPIALSDVCAASEAGGTYVGPYVWLGADVDPGTVQRDTGVVEETVEVAGTTVTVGADDEALRARILDSVVGSETCLSELPRSGPIAHDRAHDPDADPATLRVCTYRLGDGPRGQDEVGGWQLTSATDLGAGPLTAYLDAVAAGDPPRDQCPTIDYQLGEAAVLEILDDEGEVLRQDAVNTFGDCAGIAVDADRVWPLETTTLTSAMARPWVVGGVGAVLHGDPALGFIGPQG